MKILQNPISRQGLIKESTNFIDDNAIKGAVDIKRELLAVDSPMHYDCEQLLLENGSDQKDIWGINLYLDSDDIDDLVEFDSMINIRPAQGNRSRSVEDPPSVPFRRDIQISVVNSDEEIKRLERLQKSLEDRYGENYEDLLAR